MTRKVASPPHSAAAEQELAAARELLARSEFERCAATLVGLLRRTNLPPGIAGAARELHLRAESEAQREADIRGALDSVAAAWIAGDSSKMLAELARVPLDHPRADVAARRIELGQNLERLRNARGQLIAARGLLQQNDAEAARRELRKACEAGALPVALSSELRSLLANAEERLAARRAQGLQAAQLSLRAAQELFADGALDEAERRLTREVFTHSDLPEDALDAGRRLRAECRRGRDVLARVRALSELQAEGRSASVLTELESIDMADLPLSISDEHAALRGAVLGRLAAEREQSRRLVAQQLDAAEAHLDEGHWQAAEALLAQAAGCEHIEAMQSERVTQLQLLAAELPLLAQTLDEAEGAPDDDPAAIQAILSRLPANLGTWAARRRVALNERVRAAGVRREQELAARVAAGLANVPAMLAGGQLPEARAALLEFSPLIKPGSDLAQRHAALAAELQRHDRWRAAHSELQAVLSGGDLHGTVGRAAESLGGNPPEFWAHGIERLRDEAKRRISDRQSAIGRQLRSLEAQFAARGRRLRNLDQRLAALCDDPFATAEHRQQARQLIAEYESLPEPRPPNRAAAMMLTFGGAGLVIAGGVFAWTLWGPGLVDHIAAWRAESDASPVVAFARPVDSGVRPAAGVATTERAATKVASNEPGDTENEASLTEHLPAAQSGPLAAAGGAGAASNMAQDARLAENDFTADAVVDSSSLESGGAKVPADHGQAEYSFSVPPMPESQPYFAAFEEVAALYGRDLSARLGRDITVELTLPDSLEEFSATAHVHGAELLPFDGLFFDAQRGTISPAPEEVANWFAAQQAALAAAAPVNEHSAPEQAGSNEPFAQAKEVLPARPPPATDAAAAATNVGDVTLSNQAPADAGQKVEQRATSELRAAASTGEIDSERAEESRVVEDAEQRPAPHQPTPLDELLAPLCTGAAVAWDDFSAALLIVTEHKQVAFGAAGCKLAPSWEAQTDARQRILALTRSYQRFLARFASDMTPTHFVEFVATPSALYALGWQARTSGDDYMLDVAAPRVWIAHQHSAIDPGADLEWLASLRTSSAAGESLLGPLLGTGTLRPSGGGALGLVLALDGPLWHMPLEEIRFAERTVQGLRGGTRLSAIASIGDLLADTEGASEINKRRRAALWCVPALALRYRGDSRVPPELEVRGGWDDKRLRLPFGRGPKASWIAGAPITADQSPCARVQDLDVLLYAAKFWSDAREAEEPRCALLTLLPDNE